MDAVRTRRTIATGKSRIEREAQLGNGARREGTIRGRITRESCGVRGEWFGARCCSSHD